MKIALDAIGGDFGLKPNIEGALRAAAELGVQVALIGPADEIQKELSANGISPNDRRFEVIDAHDVVGMDDDPARGCREKPNSSVMVAADLVAKGKAQAFISAGNSGAAMVAALWQLKRIPGVLRPAIACPLPSAKGTTVMMDGGANTECKPWHLLQFAMMGSLYSQFVLNKENPSVGILSNGEEETKGNELVQETIPLLKKSGLNYYGPVEGRDIPAGATDVVVCDGFVGNICLKLMEGVASTIFSLLKAEIERSPIYKLGGLLMRPAARNLKNKMSYDEYGGAPLLGVNGTAIICHGKSNGKAIFNAHRVAKSLVEAKTNERLKESLDKLKSSLETANTASNESDLSRGAAPISRQGIGG